MQKVIVTGGAGFIGSNLVDKLINVGIEVIIIDNLSTGKKENVNPKATLHVLDISRHKTQIEKIMAGVDTVFHTAAKARVQPSIEDPITYNEQNVTGTLNVLFAAHNAGVKRVIYSASSSAYGNANKFPTSETHPTNPLSPYGLQKYVGEQYCKMFSQVYGLDTVSLRYFNVYGNRMLFEGAYKLVLAVFIEQMLKGKPLTITNNGNQKRDFTHVEDIVEANILAATRKEDFNGDVFNIGNGKNYSINEVADMFKGKKIYGEKRIEPFETLADNAKAKLNLGWKPKGDLKKWIINYKKELGI